MLEKRVRARLAALEAQGLTRSLEEPSGLDLCSNDYLGFARHPRIRRRFAEAAERLGAGATGSRLLRGHRAAFHSVERRFAAWKRVESALYFGSGWAANLGALSTFPTGDDVVFSDELNHASLIDGLRLSKARRVVFPHCDAAALERLVEREPCAGQRFIVTESLFSMDGDCAPLKRYATLRKRHGCALVVDEAHAVGVFGASGSGLIEEAGCEEDVFLSVNSAGKALGVSGAFVGGPEWAIEYLAQSARPFVFSTAPPPAVAEAIDEALALLDEDPRPRLLARRNAATLRRTLGLEGSDSPIVPVVVGGNREAVQAAERLRAAGFDVRAIRPPTVPDGTARLRISVNATISEAQIRAFGPRVRRILEDLGSCETNS